MIKKILLGLFCLIVVGILIFFISNKTNDNKIKLSSKYYGSGKYLNINSDDLDKLSNETYLLFTYNNYCALRIPCDKVFEEFMNKYKISILSMPIDEFKKTDFNKTVLYAPSILIIKNNKIIAYLDANSDDDLQKYQDSKVFANWLKKYISLEG